MRTHVTGQGNPPAHDLLHAALSCTEGADVLETALAELALHIKCTAARADILEELHIGTRASWRAGRRHP